MIARLIDADRAALLAAHDRLLSRAVRDPESECLLSGHARITTGYSQIRVAGRLEAAHRVAFAVVNDVTLAELRRLYVDEDLHIDHWQERGCRHRHCIEPEHLRLWAGALNCSESQRSRTRCPRGHHLDGTNLRPSELRRGKRTCRTCDRARTRVSDARRRRGEHLDLDDAIESVLADWPDMAAAALEDPVDVPTSAPTISTRLQALAA